MDTRLATARALSRFSTVTSRRTQVNVRHPAGFTGTRQVASNEHRPVATIALARPTPQRPSGGLTTTSVPWEMGDTPRRPRAVVVHQAVVRPSFEVVRVTSRRDPLALGARVDGGAGTYRFHTTDGVCSADSFRTAELRLLEHCWDESLGDLLCPQANYGVVGTVLGDGPADATHLTESSARAVQVCERNLHENRVDATVSLLSTPEPLHDRFDSAVYAPKPYTPIAAAKQRIGDALATLRPSGRLFLAAPTSAGATRFHDFLTGIAADVTRLDRSGGCLVVEATRPDTFDSPDVVSRTRLRPTVDGVELSLVSVPGLFSASSLDDGTRLLLETVAVGDGDRVLDLCCGYGPVGVYAASIADCDVVLTDDDCTATTCADRSLRESGVTGEVVTADCLDGVGGRTFDRILTNPPTHAGDAVLDRLLDGAREVLAEDGTLTIVHHRDLDLQHHLRRYETVVRRCTSGEYMVLTAHP